MASKKREIDACEDKADEEEEEDYVLRCSWSIHAPKEEWTPENVQAFILVHRHHAPVMERIERVIPSFGGIGVPRVVATFQHPDDPEELITVELSSVAVGSVPVYEKQLRIALSLTD